MNQTEIEILDSEADPAAQFFAPVSTSLIDQLLAEYRARRSQVERLADLVAGDLGNAVHYFIEGNAGDDRFHRSLYLERLFERAGALKALDAAYWSKALGATDVYESMPQKRRDEWNESIRSHTAPEFTEDAVRPTISGLLAMRQQFFAERVDGIFRALSGEHVTNAPEAFGRRMIIAYMRDGYGSINHSRAGIIADLRCVIAKFMGRDEPKYNASRQLLREMEKCTGQWVSVDGGALRIRLYKKGTAHLDVHPDIAWRLNCVLANLYPLAIPAQFRQRPPKRNKEFAPMTRPLPFSVIEVLGAGEFGRWGCNHRTFMFDHGQDRKSEAFQEAARVLVSIGGVFNHAGHVEFDFDAQPVVREICILGSIPDRASHQFYPTPERLATLAAELAEIGDGHTVLEPSAGHGDLAAMLPKERTTCVEISKLHCAVLQARGFRTVEADFIAWAEQKRQSAQRFDRIVMNPPFSDGRALQHVEFAASILAAGGRLVAILPASMRHTTPLLGFEHRWSEVFTGEFADTSASVAILTASRMDSI